MYTGTPILKARPFPKPERKVSTMTMRGAVWQRP
jgi:hypothetical protein